MIAVARALGGAGFDVVRFNFPYREKGSKRPDPMPILKDCIAQVVAEVRKQVNPRRLIIGGRSMGGRAASMLAAEGFHATGCFCSPIRSIRRQSRKSCATRTCRRSACRCCASTELATPCVSAS